MRISASIALLILLFGGVPVHAQLRGHGGPVRAVAVSPDGDAAVSGSFDASAIIWSLHRNTAEQVLRFHDAAVNAVAILPDGRIATGGADARVVIWRPGAQQPEKVFMGHTAPVAALAVSPDGGTLASASWDRTARLWPIAGGISRVLQAGEQNVNAVAFMPDGRMLVTAGYDATLRIWPLERDAPPAVATLAAPLNAAAVAADDEIIAAAADGSIYFLSSKGELRGGVQVSEAPLTAVALSPDNRTIAAASIRGAVAIIDRIARKVTRTLIGPGMPVWSVAFLPDNHTLLTGGADNMIRRWDSVSGNPVGAIAVGGPEDPLAAYAGDPGAQVFRACIACHTLRPDQGNRAGPTLAGLFGRRIATLPGYKFSSALKQLDLVWTPETVARLFEVGPATFTPGTKMPEQRITSAADRAALVRFLEKATK